MLSRCTQSATDFVLVWVKNKNSKKNEVLLASALKGRVLILPPVKATG